MRVRAPHLDMDAPDRPRDLAFAASVDRAPLALLYAERPDAVGEAGHVPRSAVLRDASGAEVGQVRFDVRRIGRDAAAEELANSGLWTEAAAAAYANALGGAMVEPLLWKLRQLAPTGRDRP